MGALRLILPIAFLTIASTPHGQSLPAVEVGLGTSEAPDVGGDGWQTFARPMFEGRVTLPITPRFSIEAIVAGNHVEGERDRTIALYLVQVRQRLKGRFQAFATYGALGFVEHEAIPEDRVTLSDGTVLVSPEFSRTGLAPPVFIVGGLGLQHQLARKVAIRGEVQGVTLLLVRPIGVRVAASASWLIGDGRRQPK
jgi:hypothetical protein